MVFGKGEVFGVEGVVVIVEGKGRFLNTPSSTRKAAHFHFTGARLLSAIVFYF